MVVRSNPTPETTLIRLPAGSLDLLRRLARERRTSMAELLRQTVLEALNAERQNGAERDGGE